MKKIVILFTLCIVILTLCLSGCMCKHEFGEWTVETPETCTEEGVSTRTCSLCEKVEKAPIALAPHSFTDATCLVPKTCKDCSATEGGLAEHVWLDATCVTPKSCSVCKKTEGDIAGHNWANATCTTQKTCTVCAEKEGDVLPHDWKAATCTAPKTCNGCGLTEGNALGHKWNSASCKTPKNCANCGITEGSVGNHVYNKGICNSCGGKNPNYEKIQDALEFIGRYPKYLAADKEILDSTYDLYSLTREKKYYTQAINYVNNIVGYLQKTIDELSPYVEDDYFIKDLVKEARDCILEDTPLTAGVTERTYISRASRFADKAKFVYKSYDVMCQNYGVS